MSAELAIIGCRFLHVSALMLAFGAASFVGFLLRADRERPTPGPLNALIALAGVLIFVTTIGVLPLQAAIVGEGWQDATNPNIVSALVLETDFGKIWLARMGLALVLAVLVLRTAITARQIALVSGLLLVSLALGGHAAMHEGLAGGAHTLNDAAHLLAGAAWVGGLVSLTVCLATRCDDASITENVSLLHRFSSAATIAVTIVILTGIINTAFVLGRWPDDWSSGYQSLLAVKISIVCAMLALAAVNRFLILPRAAVTPERAIRFIRAFAAVEVVLGIVVVAVVAALGTMDPV